MNTLRAIAAVAGVALVGVALAVVGIAVRAALVQGPWFLVLALIGVAPGGFGLYVLWNVFGEGPDPSDRGSRSSRTRRRGMDGPGDDDF